MTTRLDTYLKWETSTDFPHMLRAIFRQGWISTTVYTPQWLFFREELFRRLDIQAKPRDAIWGTHPDLLRMFVDMLPQRYPNLGRLAAANLAVLVRDLWPMPLARVPTPAVSRDWLMWQDRLIPKLATRIGSQLGRQLGFRILDV